MHPIGRVLRAHGLRGDLYVQLFRPRRDKANAKSQHKVQIDEALYTLRSVRWVSPVAAVLHFDELNDRDAAEAKEGTMLFIDPRDPPAALCDDADRYQDARATDAESGRELGVVTAVEDNGAQAILSIENEGKETLVPCVEVFIAGYDAEAHEVHIHAMPGLFDDTE